MRTILILLIFFQISCIYKTNSIKISSKEINLFFDKNNARNLTTSLNAFGMNLGPLESFQPESTWAIYRVYYYPHLENGWVTTIAGTGNKIYLQKNTFSKNFPLIKTDLRKNGTTKRTLRVIKKNRILKNNADLTYLRNLALANFPDSTEIKDRQHIGYNIYKFELIENGKKHEFSFFGIFTKGGSQYDKTLVELITWIESKI